MADPRLVAELTVEDRDRVKARAAEHGYASYGPFVVDAALRGVLLAPVLHRAIEGYAAEADMSLRDQVAELLLEAVQARRAG